MLPILGSPAASSGSPSIIGSTLAGQMPANGNERLHGGPSMLWGKDGWLFDIIHVPSGLPERYPHFKRSLHAFKRSFTVCVTDSTPNGILFWRPNHHVQFDQIRTRGS